VSAGVGWMHADIGQSWHTAGVNITPDRTRVALVGQWIPMYFRGDTELHDLDTRDNHYAHNLVLVPDLSVVFVSPVPFFSRNCFNVPV
jgi:ectoine hydroxylase-related dioxygenase (phytanoyl-CoA dioxygenase family)